MINRFLGLSVSFLMAGFAGMQAGAAPKASTKTDDAAFAKLADECISGYLAWRPQMGTTLGLHEYDGKVTDFSKASIDNELARLKSFDARLESVKPEKLSPKAAHDCRLLQSAVKREIFGFDEWDIYKKNPMTYASVLDV